MFLPDEQDAIQRIVQTELERLKKSELPKTFGFWSSAALILMYVTAMSVMLAVFVYSWRIIL